MKKLTILMLLLSNAIAEPSTPTPSVKIVSGDPARAIIQWDPNPESEQIYGYYCYLYRSDYPGVIDKRLFTTATFVDVIDFEPHVEYVAQVSAVNINRNEGAVCAPISFYPSPKTLEESYLWRAEKVGKGVLKKSTDLRTWTAVSSPYVFDRRLTPRMFLLIEY